MPLSKKFRADYIEMINQALDAIPIEKPADFALVISELEKITHCANKGGAPEFDAQFNENMQSVYDYYVDVEMWVGSRNDDAEYRKIILDRVQAKIAEFKSLNEKQQYQYVTEQKTKAEKATQAKQVTHAGEPKRSQHVVHMQTEQQMLQDQQRRYQQEGRGASFFAEHPRYDAGI